MVKFRLLVLTLVIFQTRTIELPSDSNFAVSMKSQQAAEREEQQRIKNLVLNLHEENDQQHDGTKDDPWFLSSRGLFNEPLLDGNPNTKGLKLGPESHHGGSNRSRRNRPQVRKLNLNDVDWYDKKKAVPLFEEASQPQQSFDAFVKSTKAQHKDKKPS